MSKENKKSTDLSVFILEDDLFSREIVLDLLKSEFQEITEYVVAGSLQEARDQFRKTKIDLLILDVELPDGTSFEFLEEIDAFDAPIIFTTSHSDYAIQAIKMAAVDYIIKPIKKDEFCAAVRKALSSKDEPEQNLQMKMLLSQLSGSNSQLRKIAVPSANGLEFFKIEDIIRCEASGNYTYIFLKDGSKLTISRSLKEFEELLPKVNFFRVHKSHLINLNYLKRFVRARSGIIVMDDDSKIQLASRKKEAFFDKLNKV